MSAYLTAVLADSPVHYWRLADPGGGLAHDIGSSPFHLGAGLSPRFGYSNLNSDGGCEQVTGTDFPQSLGSIQSVTSPFSLELWIWPLGQNTVNAFLWQWDGSASPESQAVYNANETVQFSVNAALTNPVTTLAPQAWHHIVGTYSGATGTLYLDGVNRGTFALAGPVTIAKKISFGGTQGSASNVFQGFMSEIAIYSVALSATRVTAHFNAADQVSNVPVYTASGGLSGAPGANTQFVGISQQLLANISTTFKNNP